MRRPLSILLRLACLALALLIAWQVRALASRSAVSGGIEVELSTPAVDSGDAEYLPVKAVMKNQRAVMERNMCRSKPKSYFPIRNIT